MKNSNEGTVKCKFCGVSNKKGREYCWKCGKLLIHIVYNDE